MSGGDASARGRAFITHVMLLFAAALFLYAFLHAAIVQPAPSGAPGCQAPPSWACFVAIDPLGDLRVVHAGHLDWYVGRATARDVLGRAESNSLALDELRQRIGLRVGAQIAPLLVDRAPADLLARQVASGRYDEAARSFDEIVASLSTLSANGSAIELVGISTDLDRLAQLKRDQQALAERLSPALPDAYFWTSPALSILEVLFWAFFGVSTQLLVRTAESLRRGEFRPPERVVGHTKLMYGPVLAVALVGASINGLIQPDDPVLRVWALPLVGFLCGYASRWIAHALDRLFERVFGRAEVAVPMGPGPEIEKRRELVEKLFVAHRPADLVQLRRQLRELSREAVEVEIAARDES
jgi:hypothetical protein